MSYMLANIGPGSGHWSPTDISNHRNYRPEVPVAGSIVRDGEEIKFIGRLPAGIMWEVLQIFFPDGQWRDYNYNYDTYDPFDNRGFTRTKTYVYQVIWEKGKVVNPPEEFPWITNPVEYKNILIQIKIAD